MPASNAFSSRAGPGGLCQSRKTKTARNFLCEIVNQRRTNLALCDDCLRIHQEKSAFKVPALDGTQRCYYCGDAATNGTTNQRWQLAVRHLEWHLTCGRCSKLEHEFYSEALEGIPDGLSPAEQLVRIEQAVRDVDQRVRDAVRGGGHAS